MAKKNQPMTLLVLLQEGERLPIRFYLVPSAALKTYDLDKMHGKDAHDASDVIADQICQVFCRCLGDIGEVKGWSGKRDFKQYAITHVTPFTADRIVILSWAV